MSSGIALFITVAVVVNILAAIWLIWWTARGSKVTNPQETTHVWDEDLTEYNNPLPRWWLWLFIISILFGFIYLALYPGLGNFNRASISASGTAHAIPSSSGTGISGWRVSCIPAIAAPARTTASAP